MPKAKTTTKAKPKKKAVAKKGVAKPKAVEPKAKKEKYFEMMGKRKTAAARVRLSQGGKGFLVNGKSLEEYFPTFELQQVIKSPLDKMDCLDKFGLSIRVRGGGYQAQAEAIRHGITKALVFFNPEFRKPLKDAGFLTRDSRMRERKKFGLKRARRAPQWRKR